VQYSDEELIDGGVDPQRFRGMTLYEAHGCDNCHGTGYKGRVAIVELLELNDQIRDLIIAKVPASQLKKAARDAGVMFLRDSAEEKFAAGITTLKEINRVTFVE
jgi:type IV pilus assembly protein PilB